MCPAMASIHYTHDAYWPGYIPNQDPKRTKAIGLLSWICWIEARAKVRLDRLDRQPQTRWRFLTTRYFSIAP